VIYKSLISNLCAFFVDAILVNDTEFIISHALPFSSRPLLLWNKPIRPLVQLLHLMWYIGVCKVFFLLSIKELITPVA